MTLRKVFLEETNQKPRTSCFLFDVANHSHTYMSPNPGLSPLPTSWQKENSRPSHLLAGQEWEIALCLTRSSSPPTMLIFSIHGMSQSLRRTVGWISGPRH